jgi:hypothetical protein
MKKIVRGKNMIDRSEELKHEALKHVVLKYVWILTIIVSTISCIAFSTATGLSVTKAVINYNDVLKGGYAEDTIYVASDTDFDIPLSYETIGDVKDWISFDPDINKTNATVYISRDHIQALKIIIQPPIDTPTGNYTGAVRVITGTFDKTSGPYGSQLQAAFLIRISVSVTGEEHVSCTIGGVRIPDVEIGRPLEYYMTVSNAGNVRVRPNVSIDFWNQDQTKLILSKSSDFNRIEVLPTTSKAFYTSFPNTLRIGQYWAYAQVYPCDQSEIVTFSVVEKGTLADNGELIRIENRPWAKIGEIVPITAYFRNSGPTTVTAKLKGVITLDKRIVENIDSDYYDVPPGEIINITVYFTPKKLGQYYISGRVLYNNKLTFEKSSILNVNEGVEQGINVLYIVVAVIVIAIILLLIAIRRKKRRF